MPKEVSQHTTKGCCQHFYKSKVWYYTPYMEVVNISLCYYDSQVLSKTLKKARKKLNITQAECAELLDFSLPYMKDLERCRCSPSIENFYHIRKTLPGKQCQNKLRLLLAHPYFAEVRCENPESTFNCSYCTYRTAVTSFPFNKILTQ